MVGRVRLDGWLHRNKFFTITGLTGWSFVYAAKTKGEVAFWYGVILCFVLLTAFNVQQLVSHFASSPVRHSMLLRSSSRDIQLPNVTLQLELPYLHFDNQLPSPISHQSCVPSSQTSGSNYVPLYDYFCSAARELPFISELATPGVDPPGKIASPKLESKFLFELLQKLEKTAFAKLINVNKSARPVDLSDDRVLEEWRTQIDLAIAALEQFWSSVIQSPVPQDRCHVMAETKRLLDEPLVNRSNDTILKLLALDALKDGTDPRSKLIDPSTPVAVKQILNALQVTPRQLFVSALSDLSKVVHIQVDPPGSVLMRDWTMSSARWVAVQGFWPTTPRQQLTLKVLVSPGVNELHIKITSFVTMWLRRVMSSWQTMMDREFTQTSCVINARLSARLTFKNIIRFMLEEWEIFNELEGTLSVLLPTSQVGPIVSLGYADLMVVSPTLLFTSKIRSCVHGAHDTCIDYDCPRKTYHTECNCMPWTHSNFNEDNRFCDGSCFVNTREKCAAICGKEVELRCSMLLTRPESTTAQKQIMYSDDHIESSIVSIKIAEPVNFVEVTAEYEMVISTLFSLLGGAIEFWGAFSITALVHFFIYCLFTTCYGRSKKWKKSNQSDMDIKQSLQELEARFKKFENYVSKRRDNFWTRARKWLNGNKFYELTPMIGYSYIAATNSKAEAIFWYFTILSFTIVAGIHLYIVVDNFTSSSSHFEAKPSVLGDVHIPNITFEFNLPYSELTSRIFQIEPLYDLESVQLVETLLFKYIEIDDDRMTNGLSSVSYLIHIFSNSLYDYLRNQTSGSSSTIKKRKLKDGALNAVDKSRRDDWDLLFENTFTDLNQIKLNKHKYSPLELQNRIPELFAQPLEFGERDDLFSKMLLLHQRKYEKVEAAEGDLSTEQLLSSTMSSLSKIISVEASEGVGVFLTDFSLDSMPALKLVFQFVVPLQLKELEVKINTLMREWYVQLTRFISQYVSKYESDRFALLVAFNNVRLLDFYNWYAVLESLNIADAPEMITPAKITQSTRKWDIQVNPKWQLISKIRQCNQEQSHSVCLQSCTMHEHEAMCGCLPWHMSHYGQSDNKLCRGPCIVSHHRPCEDQCLACNRYAVDVGFTRQEESHQNLIQFRMFVHEAMHIKLVEKYSSTNAKFVAELGGLLDMWLGMNLFALLHAAVYFGKQCFFKKRGLFRAKIEPIGVLEKELASLHQFGKQISKTAHKLRATVKRNPKQKERNFGWVWENEFFSETPLTGFGYILAAQHKWEAVLWYLLIAVFFILTVTNVHSAFQYYQAKPTSINVELLPSDHKDSFPYGNLTLTMHFPFLELSETNPMPLGYPRIVPTPLYVRDPDYKFNSVVDVLAAALFLIPDVDSGEHLLNVQYEALWHKWAQLEEWDLEQKTEHILSEDLSSETNLEHWMQIFDAAAVKIEHFLHSNNATRMPKNQMDAELIENQLAELLDAPMRRCHNAHIRLWLLDAMRSGGDPRDKMMSLLEETNATKTGVNYFDRETNGLELFKQMQHDLGFMFHVRVQGAPGVRVLVRDLTYTLRPPSVIESEFGRVGRNALGGLVLTLHVHVPEETRTDRIDFQVHSYSQMWHEYILDQFYNHYATHVPREINYIRDIIYGVQTQYPQMWLDRFITGSLQLQTASGAQADAHPFGENHFGLLFTTYFESNIERCFNASSDSCMLECKRRLYMETCSCIPWRLVYYAHAESVCTGPCALNADSVAACDRDCENALAHPCKTALYEIRNQVIRDREMSLNSSFPIYTFSLIKEEKDDKHLRYTEVYDLTLGNFISQLGGLLDLYLGFNLLAFTHLLAYVFKRCRQVLDNRTVEPTLDLAHISRAEAKMKKRLDKLVNEVRKEINKFIVQKQV